MVPDISPIAIRIRHLRALNRLNPVQLVSVVVVAILYVCLAAYLSKKKPEWSSIKIKFISTAAIIPPLIIVVFLFG